MVSAQWSASAGVDSQRVFRGLSLSDGRPSPHASLNYDAAQGGYVGASIARVMLTPGQASAQSIGYAGWSGLLDTGARWHWEVGAAANHFSADRDEDYVDMFAGLLVDAWTLRLHEAPDYFGHGVHMLYLEWNGTHELSSDLRVVAHAGVQHAHNDVYGTGARRWQADWHLGLAARWHELSLQGLWLGAQRSANASPGLYPYATASLSRPRTPWQVSIDLAF